MRAVAACCASSAGQTWISSDTETQNKPMNVRLRFILTVGNVFRGRDASYLAPPAQIRTGPIRAYGLYGSFFVKGASRHFGRPLHSILLFDPRREHSSVPTAYFHRRRAQRPSRTALLQRRRSLVLDGREHGGRLPAIGWLAAR